MPAAPSLLIVPYRSKTGKLYSQIPTSGAGDFTVTRNTTATRLNSAGVIESVASGIPRLDYYTSGGTVGCPALLVEPAATNLAFHSHLWVTASNWANTEISVVTGTTATTDPFGTNLANAISPTSGNTLHIAQSNATTVIAFTSGTIYTQSAFFKQGTGVAGRYAQLTFPGAAFSQLGYANFDLQLGTLTVVSGTSADTNRAASIENFGNGWYRCRLTGTCTSSTSAGGVGFVLATTSGALRAASFSGTVTDVIYGVGAQLETGSVATSYIPTTAGTGSRSADVISVSGAVSGSIGQTEGTIYAEVDLKVFPVAGSPIIGIISLNVGAANLQNCIILGIERLIAGTNRFYSLVQRANATQAGIFGPSISAGVFKVAFAYKENDFTMYVNGVQTGTPDTSGLLPSGTLNEVLIGTRFTGDTQFINDRIRAFALYTTRLTNAELQSLTTL